jgi:hypothetical protein
VHCTCPLSGVERTNFGGELHLCLRRNDLLKFCARNGSGKTRWGKHRGKHFVTCGRPSPGAIQQIIGRAKQERFRRLIENSGTAPPTPTTQVYAVGELGK